MLAVPGFGAGFRGWRHGADGISTATMWFLFGYLPIVPVMRCRVRRPGLAGASGRSGRVEILEGTPLSAREIAATYLWSFGGVPALALWPVLLAGWLYRDLLPERDLELPEAAHLAIAVFVLANLAGVLTVAGFRASGESFHFSWR